MFWNNAEIIKYNSCSNHEFIKICCVLFLLCFIPHISLLYYWNGIFNIRFGLVVDFQENLHYFFILLKSSLIILSYNNFILLIFVWSWDLDALPSFGRSAIWFSSNYYLGKFPFAMCLTCSILQPISPHPLFHNSFLRRFALIIIINVFISLLRHEVSF